MSDSLWTEAANRFRSTASKVVTTGLGDRKAPPPAPAPQTAPLQKSYAAERVQMAEAGGPMVAADAALKAAASRFASDGDALRMFVIGVGTQRTGRYPVATMRAAIVREDSAANGAAHAARVVAGFDAGVAAAQGSPGLTQSSLTRAPSPVVAEPTILGVPRTTAMIAGGAVIAAGVATYFFKPEWMGLKTAGDRSRRRGRRYAYARRW